MEMRLIERGKMWYAMGTQQGTAGFVVVVVLGADVGAWIAG
jgi:hypothetical protein